MIESVIHEVRAEALRAVIKWSDDKVRDLCRLAASSATEAAGLPSGWPRTAAIRSALEQLGSALRQSGRVEGLADAVKELDPTPVTS